jgi:hypothetical protein
MSLSREIGQYGQKIVWVGVLVVVNPKPGARTPSSLEYTVPFENQDITADQGRLHLTLGGLDMLLNINTHCLPSIYF